ncbi:MAG: hypothetical protein QM516_02350 [Limnohabitans sp.]|jgi:hypothetical protein|nr:hypothetical protein [Limnohabitans sp.]
MPRLTLYAANSASLTSTGVADVVRATMIETAELHGVPPPMVEIFPDRIELDGDLPDAVLLALTARVRAATDRWHLMKYNARLWQGDAGAR